jgi:large subunit ribosomal protein L13
MNSTYISALNYKKKKWFLIDCKNKNLGRLSSVIVSILSGKWKSIYFPSSDVGDYVILINTDLLVINPKMQHLYVFSPGRPGSSLKNLFNPISTKIVENCIYSMIPKNNLRNKLNKRLKVYSRSNHPHQAQIPIKLELKNL